jgi:class 3 adenylate cyclase
MLCYGIDRRSPIQRQAASLLEETMQRRLAAILAADVVGYSRLMGSDEMGTLTACLTVGN